jgi:enoyl-CoA hydratase
MKFPKCDPTHWNGSICGRAFSSSSSSLSSSTSSSPSSLVSWSVQDKIGIIELHSKATFNALTVEMGREFRSLINTLEVDFHDDMDVRAIVLQGEGDKAFSAGGNLEWLKSLSDNPVHVNVDLMLQFYTSFLCLRQKIPVPVIAALNGPAMGAGACLALACDLRVAADDETTLVLGFPFAKLGIPSGMGGLYLLQHAGISTVKANEILMLGKSLTGPQANDLGLVNRITSKDEVKQEAYKLAQEIATKHPVAIRSMIRSCRLEQDLHMGGGLSEALNRDAHAQAMCYARQDWGRGLDAVARKEEADFDAYHDH